MKSDKRSRFLPEPWEREIIKCEKAALERKRMCFSAPALHSGRALGRSGP